MSRTFVKIVGLVSYPQKEYINEAKDFMGPAELFRKNGFTMYSETEDKLVMRKMLK